MTKKCFHCDLQIAEKINFSCIIFEQTRYFCCAGCLAIAETLNENGLTDFYRFREKSSSKPEQLIPKEIQELQALDNQSILKTISTENNHFRTIELGIEGITCAACGWLIEKQLSKIEPVNSIQVNVSTQRASLVWNKDFPLSKILIELNNLGYRAYPFSENEREKSNQTINRSYIKRLVVAGLAMMQVMSYALGIYIGEFQYIAREHQIFLYWISGIVATPVVFYSAKPFFISAWNNLKARQLGMNLPISIAILTAYFASFYSLIFKQSTTNNTASNIESIYFDSVVMFTFFLLVGRYLEHRARYQSILKQQNFRELVPLSATKIIDYHLKDFDSEEIELHIFKDAEKTLNLPLSEVKENDKLIIYAGAVIPVDGILFSKKAQINESIVTGEYLPISKNKGDKLTSGSTNNSATFIMQVTNDFNHSRVTHLIQLQQNAELVKPDSVALADRISHWYIFSLLSIVLISILIWWQIDSSQVLPIALSILVVSCPCALSLATPATIAAATAQLSDIGLFVKNKNTLQNLASTSDVFFDKTGTLTTGHLKLVETKTYSTESVNSCLSIAASLEQISNHPIANTIKSSFLSRQQSADNLLADNFLTNKHSTNNAIFSVKNAEEIIGQGVKGRINQCDYLLGNQKLTANQIENKTKPESHNNNQLIEVKLYKNSIHLASFYFQDKLKQHAIETVKSLQNIGLQVSLISGDNKNAVSYIAQQIGIKHFKANHSPEQKFEAVKDIQKQNKKILMVGDGFNDVGALAAANSSITVGTSTNISQSASDAVLISADLRVIYKAIKLAQKSQRIIKQNLSWAIVYNLLAIPFAAMGYIPAWLAAIGMSLSSLIVVLNALRLRK